MIKWDIISLTVLVLLALNAHAWASVDDPFTDPRPTYRDFDWTFGAGYTLQATDNGKWYNISLYPHVGKSQGDGTAYNDRDFSCYWTSISGMLNGFSVSNSIGDWLYAIGVGVEATIRYTIREDYSSTGHVANSDIMEINAQEVETLIKHGHGVPDSLGLSGTDDITALEWNVDFDDENLKFEHFFAVQGSGGVYNPNVFVGRNMDDEAVYMTWGAKAHLDASNNLYRTYRANKYWDGTTNGFASHPSYYITVNGNTGESLGDPTFDGTNWFLPVTVSGTTYSQRMDLPYVEADYPETSGAPIQWYDDYDLGLAGSAGVSGRYILERDEFIKTSTGYSWAHAADVCYEARTYNPTRNPDGPESPYKWVYDGSGDMYVPTDTIAHPTPSSDPSTRAYELIGNHPAFPDDDTYLECEYPEDRNIWKNQLTGWGSCEGVVSRGLFVESWRLAGLMLGQEFWNVNPDYIWSGEIGAVAERTWAVEFMDLGGWSYPDDKLPVWTWDGSEWVLPTTYDLYNTGVMDRLHIWDWVNDYTDTPVAGYGALNNFMRYVFDIDALVVEDADGDGEFDVGDDYILFSVVDDGLYHFYPIWGKLSTYDGSVSTPFDGVYFDGDTIFLYDGTSVTTYFDAEAGIFFGQAISTLTGFGTGQTLWSTYDIYDIEALDINIIPEPSAIFLMIGSGGLAVLAGIMRRKLR